MRMRKALGFISLPIALGSVAAGLIRPTHLALASASPAISEISGRSLVTDQAVRIDLATAAKATVLVFLSAKCPCSASHEIALRELHSRFSAQGFNFVGLHANLDEPPTLAHAHFQATNLPFPVVEDVGQAYANYWGALKTPHVFVVSPRGEVLFQGGVDDRKNHLEAKQAYLKEALAAISEGREPPVKIARSLGCVIKR